MKFYADSDEWYPVYDLTPVENASYPRGPEWELDFAPAFFRRYQKAREAFVAVQDEIEAAMKARRELRAEAKA